MSQLQNIEAIEKRLWGAANLLGQLGPGQQRILHAAMGLIFLRPEAQFDHLVGLPDSADRAAAIITAMEGIGADYESLRGVSRCSRGSSLRHPIPRTLP